MKKMVIFGVGPGLGMSLARKFGANNYEIILLARSRESLRQYCDDLLKENIKASYYIADAASAESVSKVFQKLCADQGHIDLFIYNIGFLEPNRILELTQSKLLKTLQMDVTSGLLSTQIIYKNNDPKLNSDILFTGGGISISPEKSMASLSIGKAGLRSLVFLLAQEFESSNVFVSTITICGGIKSNTHFDPANIAEVYWKTVQDRNQTEIFYR